MSEMIHFLKHAYSSSWTSRLFTCIILIHDHDDDDVGSCKKIEMQTARQDKTHTGNVDWIG